MPLLCRCAVQPLELSVVRADSGSRRLEPCAVYDTVDHNAPQLFALSGRCSGVVALRLHFPASTDMFGRVTIYGIDVTGAPSSEQ